jgi:hypothetical protein
MFSSESQL